MLRFIAKRIFWMVPSLIIVSFLAFVLIQLPPGDYVTTYIATLAASNEVVDRNTAADLRVGPRTQAVGELGAKLDLYRSTRHLERLKIGVGDHKLYAFNPSTDHAVDGVAAATTYADDFNFGVVAGVFVEMDADFGVGHV